MTAKVISDPSLLGWELDANTGRWMWVGGGTAELEANIADNALAISANTNAIADKLDADTIWTGTEAQYSNLSPDADTLYFITENVRAGSADILLPDMGQMPSANNSNDVSYPSDNDSNDVSNP
jgi:hypothetical protein